MDHLITDKKDPNVVAGIMKKYGICLFPGYCGTDFTGAIVEKCQARAEVPCDANFLDGSYRRYDSYQGTPAAQMNRVYHADIFCEEANQFLNKFINLLILY